ncbi:MAG TPA: transporter substrate-binding domain-containing protein [Sphingomicrobium sp.]|jgi:polar amino acid transport system substrate-binding protein|nr:transporter substrate-binding domain-containing protein [Sphingomicrobium sp.]
MKRLKLLASLALSLSLVTVGGCAKQQASKVINVAVTPASPPNLFEENGQTKGLDYDLFAGYCKSRGCTMNITAYDWQGMLGAVVSKKADVAFSGISITEPREKVMDFSKPYMKNNWDLVSLKSRNIKLSNLDTLKKYTIGFPRGMAYMDFIKNKLEPKGIYNTDQVKLYPSYNEALTDLQNGHVDLVFLDGTVASVYRKKLPIQDSYVFEGIDKLGFAFPKGSKLRPDFDKYLDELGPAKLQAIIDKWMK